MKTSSRKASFAAVLALGLGALLPGAALAVGETEGRIAGYVYDPTGAPLAEVPLTVSGTALLQPIHRTSGEDGRFEFDLLPPGENYAIEVNVPGFTPIRQTGIKVRLGQTTPADVNLTVLTEQAAAQTFQIIEKVNPILNPDSAQATVVVTAEKAAETPAFTQTEGIPQQVAGTTFSNKPSTRGGLSRYGKFYVDGLDTTDITDGSITGLVNFFTVDNWEVVTGGFDAQYNSLGMVENVVTKSGSNRFTYDAVLTLAPPFLIAQNNVPSGSAPYVGNYTNSSTPPPLTSFYSPILSVGGPIVPDRLWFYASAQVNLSDRQTPIATFYQPIAQNRPTDTLTQIYRAKVTWQPTERDRVSLTFNLDHNTIDNSTGSSSVSSDAETKIDRGGIMIVGTYDHNFSDNVLFQLQTGATYKNVNNDPEHVSANASHFDRFNGTSVFNAGRLAFGQDENWLHEAKTRIQFDPSLTWKLKEHSMKAGVQVSYMLDTQVQGVYGNSRYTDNGGNPAPNELHCDEKNLSQTAPFCFERTDFYAGADVSNQPLSPGGPLSTNANALTVGAFVQDRWTVNRKLTVVPGLRADYGDMLGDPTSPPAPVLFGWGPRLSSTYDMFGDRKTLFTAHYGRSNDVGNVFIAQHANPALLEVNSFFTGGAFPGCSTDPAVNAALNKANPGSCTTAGGVSGRSYALSNGSRRQDPPYVDEVQAGWHQEWLSQTAFGVDLDYRHYGKLWVDEEVNRIFDPSGQKIIGYQNGVPQSILVARTSPAAFRNYEGMDLWVQGNPGHWDLYAAYTLSFNQGTMGDYFDGFMADPRMNQFAYGYTGDDHRHTFKASIAYSFPIGLDIGIRARYQSGGALWETFTNNADSNLNWYRSPRGTGYPVNNSTGLPNFNDPTQWAELRTPDWFQIDAEARYNLGALLGLKQKVEVAAFVVDALNDYNAGSTTSFYSTRFGATCAVTPPTPGACVNKFGNAPFRNGPLQGEVLLRFRN